MAISEAALTAWIEERWPRQWQRPTWDRSVFKELMTEEMDRRAKAEAESATGRQLADLRRRVATLERAAASLEDTLAAVLADERKLVAERISRGIARGMKAARVMHYRGVWSATEKYAAGAAVTKGGALWIATSDAEPGEKPGGGATSWRLAVKSPPPTKEHVVA